MWLNSRQREEPYQGLTSQEPSGNRGVPRKGSLETGGAWLSSARVVRCWVKFRNERNPYPMLPAGYAGHSCETARAIWRKVGTTSSPHAPYALGCTHATMDGTMGRKTAR